MIPRPRRKIERLPVALGPTAPNKMPRKLVRPADEAFSAGLARFLKHHWAAPKLVLHPTRKPAT